MAGSWHCALRARTCRQVRQMPAIHFNCHLLSIRRTIPVRHWSEVPRTLQGLKHLFTVLLHPAGHICTQPPPHRPDHFRAKLPAGESHLTAHPCHTLARKQIPLAHALTSRQKVPRAFSSVTHTTAAWEQDSDARAQPGSPATVRTLSCGSCPRMWRWNWDSLGKVCRQISHVCKFGTGSS